ncbi:MAG TPA: hypothetical protein VFG52_12535 [Xanthomonadales bacterium]|nr:hypothetical protein [Xanthomonadales bacterium]
MNKLLTLLVLGVMLASCDDGPTRPFHGALYFGQGAYLMRLSLTDGGQSIVGHLGDTIIRQVTALGNDDLLVAESASVNRLRVSRISWVDPKTGETADLYAGTLVEHLADPGVVVYDDGSELYAVPQQAWNDNEVVFSHPQKPLSRLLEASPGILLIETGDTDTAGIIAWDARTGTLRDLPGLAKTCRLVGAVWIDSLERLACKQRAMVPADSQYVLTDLEGKADGRLALPEDKDFFALVYIENQNTLVLRETRQSWLGKRDKYAVWMHDLESGESYRVANNVNLGNSVVYANF